MRTYTSTIAHEKRQGIPRSVCLLGMRSLVVLLVLLSFARKTLVIVSVKNRSMAPTLQDGDRVLVLRYWPAKWLRKGQIVLVCWPYEPAGPRALGVIPPIKRIAGLAGETISLPVTELYDVALDGEPIPVVTADHTFYVPAKHLFVCSHNPQSNVDSRSWGPVPYQSVVGVVLMQL